MKIKAIDNEMGRDFYAVYVCEHCGHEYRSHGYHDTYFHTEVIPGKFCPQCGLNRAGKKEPDVQAGI